MVDLLGQYNRLRPNIDAAVQRVLTHTQFINGPETHEFARMLADYLEVGHVLPCANGTDALQLALMAMEFEEGDEVIVPTFTFGATVEVIALLGLRPVFVDVDARTFTIDAAQAAQAFNSRTRAVVPVHLFGQGADMDGVMQLAHAHDLYVIEDAAQCLGASYTFKNGRSHKLGTIGDVGCTSFFPSKNLGCFGDGGACVTNHPHLAEAIKCIANHGSEKKYHQQRIGVNSRLDTLQAAVLGAKLPHLDEFNRCRQQAAGWYDAALGHIAEIELPLRAAASEHIFHQYTIKIKKGSRDGLADYLKQHGVPTMVYYPVPMHRQEAFKKYVPETMRFPVSEQLAGQVLSLPMHTELTEEQVAFVSEKIAQYFSVSLKNR